MRSTAHGRPRALGVRNAFLEQTAEVGGPNLFLRFGRGPTLPFSMPRPGPCRVGLRGRIHALRALTNRASRTIAPPFGHVSYHTQRTNRRPGHVRRDRRQAAENSARSVSGRAGRRPPRRHHLRCEGTKRCDAAADRVRERRRVWPPGGARLTLCSRTTLPHNWRLKVREWSRTKPWFRSNPMSPVGVSRIHSSRGAGSRRHRWEVVKLRWVGCRTDRAPAHAQARNPITTRSGCHEDRPPYRALPMLRHPFSRRSPPPRRWPRRR